MTVHKCMKANSAIRGTIQLPRVWSLALSSWDWFPTNHEGNGVALSGFHCFQPEPVGKSCSPTSIMLGNFRSWQLSVSHWQEPTAMKPGGKNPQQSSYDDLRVPSCQNENASAPCLERRHPNPMIYSQLSLKWMHFPDPDIQIKYTFQNLNPNDIMIIPIMSKIAWPLDTSGFDELIVGGDRGDRSR